VVTRAVSTVVDTLLFLLLVSAAVFVVTGPTTEPVDVPADDTAEVLATSTATVEYEVGREGETIRQRARGTYAGLLGRAAVANATFSGRQVAPDGPAFAAEVRGKTAAVLGANTQVSARWTPYPGAPVAGQVTVGPDPPPRADVRVARLRVPVAVPSVDPERTYGSVASGVSRAVARGMLPGSTAGLPLGNGPHRRAVAHRFDVLTRGSVARTPAEPGDVTAARDVAARALAPAFAADLRGRFDSPRDAATAVETGTATVVVRRWKG
jgi:hypothetical protein